MRPKEFVARVIDLFEFDMAGGGDWSSVRPVSFSGAALCIKMASTNSAREIGGYRFLLESEQLLGHTVIRATMVGENNCVLGGAICFTFQDYDTMPLDENTPEHEHIFESWQVPSTLRDRVDDIVSMITYLTLKTNYKIQHKTS